MFSSYRCNIKLLLVIVHFCFKYLHYAEKQLNAEMSYTFPKVNHFNGNKFYEEYRGAEFMTKENIEKILASGEDFRLRIGNLPKPSVYSVPAKMQNSVQVDGMFIKPNVPLVVYQSVHADEHDISGELFTARRLLGLVAAYVYSNFQLFPDIYATESEALGLDWDNTFGSDQKEEYRKQIKRKMYLSAVPGAEYYVEQFEHYPLICGLKKFQRKEISVEELLAMAKIRLSTGERTATKCMLMAHSRTDTTKSNEIFTFGRTFDLVKEIDSAPEQVKCLFTYTAVTYVANVRKY